MLEKGDLPVEGLFESFAREKFFDNIWCQKDPNFRFQMPSCSNYGGK
jgi:hypothetical protein